LTAPRFECRECGESYEAVFFRVNSAPRSETWTTYVVQDSNSQAGLKARCRLCEITERTEAKRANRFREKARRTLRNHAKKYGQKTADFAADYGWDIDVMARDISQAGEHECLYCREAFTSENGLGDISLDIVDREKPPHYETNVRWCCRTCNQIKGTTDPAKWGDFLRELRRWKARRAKLKENRWSRFPLFEGLP